MSKLGESTDLTHTAGFQFRRREERTKWQTLQQQLYNPNNHTVCGRSAKSWIKVVVFYSIFYTGLAALFAICMQGLLATLDDRTPKWTLDNGLIGTNPGLGFRPISTRTEEGSLIWYQKTNYTTISKWVTLLDKFLELYKRDQTGGNYQSCDFQIEAKPAHVCTVNLDKFGPCSPQNAYGYNSSSPCVFLKLNKIFDWVPEYYTESDPEMPSDLQETINNLPASNRKQIWISCEGKHPADKELANSFNYYPSRGFPGYYYPYQNTKNYLSPLIAVQVANVTPNIIVSIECRAWAKNIKYRGVDSQREGSVRFEIMQDV